MAMQVSEYQENLWKEIATYKPIFGRHISLPEEYHRAYINNPRHKFLDRFRTIGEIITGPTREMEQASSTQLAYTNQPLLYVDDNDRVLVASSSEPAFIFHLLALLDPKHGQGVLEIGCGTGWLLSIISDLVGADGSVTGIEVMKYLGEKAKNSLSDKTNTEVIIGDGMSLNLGDAKYDRIIFTASTYAFPEFLFDALRDGGRVVIPIQNKGPGEEVHVLKKSGNSFVSQERRVSKFVPIMSNATGESGSFTALDKLTHYPSLIEKETSSELLDIGHIQNVPRMMMSMMSLASYLSRVEPDFLAVSWKPDGGYGSTHETAVFGDPDGSCYGIFPKDQKSMAIWHKGTLTGYGNSDAAELFKKHAEDWAALGYPTSVQYNLTITKPSEDKILSGNKKFYEERQGGIFNWSLET